MVKTAIERKAEQRQRDKDAGLVRVDVKVHHSRVDELKAKVTQLQKPKKVRNKLN